MNPRTSEAMRANARFFSVVFQTLALLTLFGTILGALEVAKLGAQIGIAGSRDPAAWIVLIGGFVATFVFAGFGYTLGILCAIYDRQVMPPEEIRRTQLQTPDPEIDPPRAPLPEKTIWQQVVKMHENEVVIAEDKPAPPTSSTTSLPDSTSGLWDSLTRERHLFKRPD